METPYSRNSDAEVSRSGGTKQASEVRARWAWTEPCVWTNRMLSALEQGVKGGVWFSLSDKVFSLENLQAAANKVIANKGAPGVDGVTVEQYAEYRERYLPKLSEALHGQTWKPKAIKRKAIPKPGSNETRPLGIPCVEDRVVQTALRQVLEPVFEREFHEYSFGFRPGRGCKDALRMVDDSLRQGYAYVVDADLRKFFDTIPHDLLMGRVAERVSDSRVLELIEAFLHQEVMDDMQRWTPETGTPQGAVISPLLANVFLNPLDHAMASQGFRTVRYADDSVILCRSREEAQAALAAMTQWCEDNGLTIHPDKTHIADMNQPGGGFEFLGYRFQCTRDGTTKHWASKKAEKKLRDRIRPLTKRCYPYFSPTQW
jgi:RNA-directed DNA polymerase